LFELAGARSKRWARSDYCSNSLTLVRSVGHAAPDAGGARSKRWGTQPRLQAALDCSAEPVFDQVGDHATVGAAGDPGVDGLHRLTHLGLFGEAASGQF